jgi:UDP-N-acetylmuramoyl-L-alanyl-D-glutamate--2,6-diaminopimelate ligase
VDFRIGSRVWHNETRQTTPEAPEVQELLAEMVQEQVDYAVLECTSHGLALHRVACCEYDVGVFTNLTGDHLDFHQTMEQYRYDKARLFRALATAHGKGIPKTSVLNADDSAFAYMKECSPPSVLSYGLEEAADITARDVRLSPWSTTFITTTPAGDVPIVLPLPGRFNVYNALAAVGVGLSQEVPLDTIKEALASFEGVPGRMQRIDRGQPFNVIVDYAHTPDGLMKVLHTLRPLTKGRLMVIFGCAGERDKGRRYGMGKVAADLGDYSVLTNEDPRFEDPGAILDDIEAGIRSSASGHDHSFVKIPDRREAMRFAFREARSDDLVLLTGKGHERCIIIGNERLPWDDSQVAAELLDKMR